MLGSLEGLFWAWVSDLTALARFVVDRVSPPTCHVLRHSGNAWEVSVVTAKGEAPAGRLLITPAGGIHFEPAGLQQKVAGTHVSVAVPENWVFWQRDVSAPAGMMPFLESYVRTGFEQFSPWRFEDCYLALFPPASHRGSEPVIFSLAIVRRALLTALTDALLVATPARIDLDVASDIGTGARDRISVPLTLRTDRRQRSERIIAGVLASIIILGVGLFGARSWYEFILSDEIAATEADIATETNRLNSLQERIDRNIAARTLERQTRSPQLPAFQVLEALSRILPDSVYLTSLRTEANKVHLSGIAKSDVAGLIPLLEHSRLFSAVTFSAPTTRTPAGTGEHFAVELVVNDRSSLNPIRRVGP